MFGLSEDFDVSEEEDTINARIDECIRRYQRSTELLIPRASFVRQVRSIMNQHNYGSSAFRIQNLAVQALQEAAEAYIVGVFENANMYALHARRTTIMPKDLELVRMIRGREK